MMREIIFDLGHLPLISVIITTTRNIDEEWTVRRSEIQDISISHVEPTRTRSEVVAKSQKDVILLLNSPGPIVSPTHRNRLIVQSVRRTK